MNKDILDKLNALLRRVQTRSGESRDDANGDGHSSEPLADIAYAADAPELELGDTLVDAELPIDAIEDGDETFDVAPPESAPRLAVGAPADEIARAAFDREEPPSGETHSAPPDSGRLPKASESTPVEEFDDAEITGVHAAPAAALAAQAAQAAQRGEVAETAERADIDDSIALERSGEHRTMPRALIDAERIAPVVTRAPIDAEPKVDVIASANRFSPRTIGELLDATLGL